jgi:CheY-like chemotaxis protein
MILGRNVKDGTPEPTNLFVEGELEPMGQSGDLESGPISVEEVGSAPTTLATAILALTRDLEARDLLMEVAVERGYGLCCAGDSAEAIRTLEAEPPALLVIDIDTPEGRGLLRALRAEERWRGIPVFALTATNNPMASVTIDAPVFFKPELGGLEEAILGRFESTEHALPGLSTWLSRPPSA